MVYLASLVILLIPYWLGPIVVWLTQRAGAPSGLRAVHSGAARGARGRRRRVPPDLRRAHHRGLSCPRRSVPERSNEARQHPCRDGRTVSIHNSPVPGSFTPPPSRVVVPLPIVQDPARLCRITRAYLERHYRGVERAPFEHQDEPARFLGGAMVRELTEQVEAGAWRRSCRT